jgi:hypothetical protein
MSRMVQKTTRHYKVDFSRDWKKKRRSGFQSLEAGKE